MSRIRLEWNVESQQIDRSDGEDPEEKRRRRRSVLILLALIFLLLLAIALAAALVRQRIHQVERQFEQLLQDTVKAEVAALRIGDLNSFLNIQSADDASWVNRQRAMFQHYSDLKSDGAIELTGSILAADVDGERARALVQENINDLPYARLWFYRRAGDGWQHTAPDYSFWGAQSELESENAVVSYRAADRDFALQLSDALDDWLGRGCDILECGNLPKLSVAIVADDTSETAWINERQMQLRIRSPYIDITRADRPFDGWLQLQVSTLLAERLVDAHTGYLVTREPHDAAFLRQSAIAWLSEVFTRLDSGATLMRSLADNYGAGKIARLLAQMTATSGISLLQEVINQPFESADLDWRDFVEWRLALEQSLIRDGRENDWLKLYDTSLESARLAAYDRFNAGAQEQIYRVIDLLLWSNPAGKPQLRATVRVNGNGEVVDEIVLFNLVNDVWKRAS
ncbi:MAG: hypothetical protein OXG23_03360 [Chloroflexi bacterium]|nr:hypothetical protein [Chloroflexota bacterium]